MFILSAVRVLDLLACCFLLDMPFGASNQKFPMGGLGFEGQQGMGPSSGGLLGNEMVTYPTFWKIRSWCSLCSALLFVGKTPQLIFKHEGLLAKQDGETRMICVPSCLRLACWLLNVTDMLPAWSQGFFQWQVEPPQLPSPESWKLRNRQPALNHKKLLSDSCRQTSVALLTLITSFV